MSLGYLENLRERWQHRATESTGWDLAECTDLLKLADLGRARFEVDLARWIDAVATSGVFRDDGHATVAAWCRAVRRWSNAETSVRVRLAKLLANYPDLADEITSGRLGVAQAQTIAKAAANPRCGDQIGDSLAILLEHADKMSHADFQRLVGHWERLADADGAHKDADKNADKSHRARRASWSTDDDSGDFHLSLTCGAAQGAEVRSVVDEFTSAEFQSDWDACVAEHGDQATPDLLQRSDGQRRADAIVAIALAAASTPADAQPPSRSSTSSSTTPPWRPSSANRRGRPTTISTTNTSTTTGSPTTTRSRPTEATSQATEPTAAATAKARSMTTSIISTSTS